MSPAGEASSFDHAQTEAIYPPGVERHWWSAARNRIIDRLLGRFADRSDPIMEIGCGTGVVVDHLAGRGWDVRGCDLAQAKPASARAAERICLGVDALKLPSEDRAKIRGVLLLDVLEHIEDPRAMLASVAEGFENLDWLFATLPARQELWSNYDEFNRHFRRYDLPSARALATGPFDPEACGYFFHSLWAPARLLKLLGRDRSTEFRAPTGPAAGFHTLLAALFDLEQRVVPAGVVGSSVWIAMRRVRS